MTTNRTEQITEAQAEVDKARHDFETARTSKARLEAAERLDFWTSKTAYLTHAR